MYQRDQTFDIDTCKRLSSTCLSCCYDAECVGQGDSVLVQDCFSFDNRPASGSIGCANRATNCVAMLLLFQELPNAWRVRLGFVWLSSERCIDRRHIRTRTRKQESTTLWQSPRVRNRTHRSYTDPTGGGVCMHMLCVGRMVLPRSTLSKLSCPSQFECAPIRPAPIRAASMPETG